MLLTSSSLSPCNCSAITWYTRAGPTSRRGRIKVGVGARLSVGVTDADRIGVGVGVGVRVQMGLE